MSRALRVVLLTGNERRHRYAATTLAYKTNLVGIVSEAKPAATAMRDPLPQSDGLVIDQHFAERDTVERRLLGDEFDFPDTLRLEVPNGAINSPAVFEWVQRHVPNVVVLYGTSIVRPPLLDYYARQAINLHLGLSPYYRGSGTNFWPLVHRQPECVGATIHLATARVDAGPILAQVRPEAEIGDRAHELGTKTIMAGFDLMPRVLCLYVEGKVQPQPQDLSHGHVFRRRDFNAAAVRRMWHHFDTGMMAEYLAEAEPRYRRYPIVHIAPALR